MSIISPSDFKNEFYIPLANGTISGTTSQEVPDNNTYLQSVIDEVQEDLLLNSLGLEQYNELVLALPITDDSAQKWKDLVNGRDINGKKWEGLKNILLASTYYFFNTEKADVLTAVGIAMPESENATRTTPRYKLASAWQKFIEGYQGGYVCNPIVYNDYGYPYLDYYQQRNRIKISLYEYLQESKETYSFENQFFRIYENINTFGI